MEKIFLLLLAVHSHALSVALGPLGICPTVTVQLQPFAYCGQNPYTTVINPFSTDVCTSTYLTSTILPTSPSATQPSTSQNAASSNIGSASSETTTAPTSILTTGAATPTSGSGLFIGQGLPAGFVIDLPIDQFVFLAFTNAPAATAGVRKRRDNILRQVPENAISPLALVNLGVDLIGGFSQDDCDTSSPLLLRAGFLRQYDKAVTKLSLQDIVELGFLSEPANSVQGTFSFQDGFLQWNTPEEGPATFYDCTGRFFAAFGGTQPTGCEEILVGAINGQACVDRVRQTRLPNPDFTAPIYTPRSASSSTTGLGPSTKTSSISTTSQTAASVNPSIFGSSVGSSSTVLLSQSSTSSTPGTVSTQSSFTATTTRATSVIPTSCQCSNVGELCYGDDNQERIIGQCARAISDNQLYFFNTYGRCYPGPNQCETNSNCGPPFTGQFQVICLYSPLDDSQNCKTCGGVAQQCPQPPSSSKTAGTSTSVTTSMTTSTSATPRVTHGVQCELSGTAIPRGGCSSNCNCYPDLDGGGRCWTGASSGSPPSCRSDMDCPGDDWCYLRGPDPYCASNAGCTSTYVPISKRGAEMELVRVFKRAAAKRRMSEHQVAP